MSWRPPVRTVLVSVLALGAAACAGVTPTSSQQNPDGGGVDKATMSTMGGPDAPSVTDTRPNAPDLSIATDGGACTPSVTCDPPNGRYCGVDRQRLLRHDRLRHLSGPTRSATTTSAWAAPAASPLACQTTTGNYCGTVGNGCGKAMDCGACDSSLVCAIGRLRSRRRLHAADLHDRHRPLLRHHRRRLRRNADVRRLSRRLDLRRRGRREHLRAHQLHARHLHGGGRRPLLRQHRRRLRAHAGLRRLHRRPGLHVEHLP